ncbi:ig-like domain-containing protein [Trichonephila clavipes]|nr:ig-like domain-containing protein [Trichonephila clavipes]
MERESLITWPPRSLKLWTSCRNIPQLVLRLGSKLRHFRIQEGNDVYMECDIRANPWVTEIGWTFEGRELHTNVSAGLIISNQSLVLQRVQRTNRGHYTCSASNTEGIGESKPLYLSIQCEYFY